MNMPEIIQKKKDGLELCDDEIRFFTEGYERGIIPDYQMSALFMAIYFKGMTSKETKTLALSMAQTGKQLDLSSLPGRKVDKHSSGGVGDKTSLIVAPVVAACGLTVAKMSGRGLGFSGGTIDKLEAIPGFIAGLTGEEFLDAVKKTGLAITGQTENIAPVDKKMYALRDVTATVDNLSLIAASIMSKKLACLSDAIVLDVKTGRGAFMKTFDKALGLSKEMVATGVAAGRETVALITNMDAPLGNMIGNALEIKEAVRALKGEIPDDLRQVCFALGTQMLILGRLASDENTARNMFSDAIKTGRAFDKFIEFISVQGGDISVLLDTEKLPKAKIILPVLSEKDGMISGIDAEAIGRAAIDTGAGRYKKDDVIDYAAGIELVVKNGQEIKKGEILAYIHSNSESGAKLAAKRVAAAYEFGGNLSAIPMIRAIVKDSGVEYFD